MTRLFYFILLLNFISSPESLYSQINETDDFESYEVDAFPIPYWRDVRDISIPVNAPNPSAEIIETIAWDGSMTKAIQFKQGVTTSCGIFREIDTCEVYRLSAEIRVDKWSNASQAFFAEWAVAIGIFSTRPGWDFNATPQITFVAQPFAENWVLYVLRDDANSTFNYYNLEFPNSHVELNTWYHVELVLDDFAGTVFTKVTNTETGEVTHEALTSIPNWTPGSSGNFNHYGTWDGEYGTDATIGNQATVDNFHFDNEIISSTNYTSKSEIKIYPNPAQKHLYIENRAGLSSMKITDLNGNMLSRIEGNGKLLVKYELTDLSRGPYLLWSNLDDKQVNRPVLFFKY